VLLRAHFPSGDLAPSAFNPDRLMTPEGSKQGQQFPFGAGARCGAAHTLTARLNAAACAAAGWRVLTDPTLTPFQKHTTGTAWVPAWRWQK
jgi:hypothetical protein